MFLLFSAPPPRPKPIERPANRPAAPALPACVSGRAAALNGGCSYVQPHFTSGSSFFRALDHGLSVGYHWVMEHRVAIADYGALGVCLSVVLSDFCAPAQAAAYAIRVQYRIEKNGFKASMQANVADGVITAWSMGLGAAGDYGVEQGPELSFIRHIAINGAFSIPDFVNEIGGHLPGHDPVFYSG